LFPGSFSFGEGGAKEREPGNGVGSRNGKNNIDLLNDYVHNQIK